MITIDDVIAGKIVSQLGLATSELIRRELTALSQEADSPLDLVNRLTVAGLLHDKSIALVRHRVSLYDHVRAEAAYLRRLEQKSAIPRQTVALFISELERTTYRRRLGDVLVRKGRMRHEDDQKLLRRVRRAMERENERIIARYAEDGFEGATKPLIPGKLLDPEDFKISTLFRSKATRALVSKLELDALRKQLLAAKADNAVEAAEDEDDDEEEAEDTDALANTLLELDPNDTATGSTAANLAGLMETADGEASGDDERPPELGRVLELKRIADYAILELLGAGGMGAVFLGQKDGAGELVAIKVLLNNKADAEEKGRFAREIELTRKIRHPNVLGIIDSGVTADSLTYLVVPAMAGKELRDLLDAGPLAPDVACGLIEQVLEGLSAMHEQQIVHRDIKPENVFVMAGAEREIRLMDLGLAKLAEEADREASYFKTLCGNSGNIAGSPAYMAPEMVTCDPIDGRTDIYCTGVMFFEMLTGKLPLESETAQGYLTQHMICPPNTLAESAPERYWDPEVEQLLAHMLGKLRPERPANCQEILTRLRGGLREKVSITVEPGTETAVAPAPEPVSEPAPVAPKKKYGFKGLLGRLRGALA